MRYMRKSYYRIEMNMDVKVKFVWGGFGQDLAKQMALNVSNPHAKIELFALSWCFVLK